MAFLGVACKHNKLLRGAYKMPSKKIVCLGGGSGYFTRALGDIIATPGLAESEITLYDIDMEKAEIMAQHGTKLASQNSSGINVRACKTLDDAIDGADFAVSSIGGAGVSVGGIYGTSAHIQDVLVPAKYGIYQVVGDTAGPAGMMMGLRSLPIYINICREMEKRCPDVIFMNHSNPMAVLCRAMDKYTNIKQIIGVCHGVQGGIISIANMLGISPHELDCVWIGTNHYHWFTRIYYQGEDIYPKVRKKLAERENPTGELMTHKLSQIYGHTIVYPPDDHAFEFYPFTARLANVDDVPYGFAHELKEKYAQLEKEASKPPTKAEKMAQREAYLKDFAEWIKDINLPDAPSDPLIGEGLGSLIEAVSLGRRQVQIVNIENKGAVPNLPSYANLEIEAVTDSCGVRGIYIGDAPMSLKGLLEKKIAWQELVVDAGVKGDENLALQALLLDEAAILPEKAEMMLSELLHASKKYLPQFRL
jgi:alpha-galactosidase